MRVLITGGAGFIGSNLADKLLDDGHEVFAIDNCLTGRRENLPRRPGLTFWRHSIEHRATIIDAFAAFQPTHVVHAAASYHDPANWHRDATTNVAGTANVVQACSDYGIDRLIYFQTSLCYGTRPDEQPITLGHPLRPDSSYAITKTAGEQLVRLLPDHVSFRLANCYGPRNLSGPVPAFYKRLAAGESCVVADTRRDFVYVDDLIDVVMLALDGVGRGAYHVSSGTDYSISEVYRLVRNAMGLPMDEFKVMPRSPDDAATILLDPTRTAQDFNWMPSTNLAIGIGAAVAYYREHGVGETYTHLRMPARAPVPS